MKTFDLNTVVVNHVAIQYFYKREKNDINGNPRHRVYIIDPNASAIYETIFKCYDGQIKEYVAQFVEAATC